MESACSCILIVMRVVIQGAGLAGLTAPARASATYRGHARFLAWQYYIMGERIQYYIGECSLPQVYRPNTKGARTVHRGMQPYTADRVVARIQCNKYGPNGGGVHTILLYRGMQSSTRIRSESTLISAPRHITASFLLNMPSSGRHILAIWHGAGANPGAFIPET